MMKQHAPVRSPESSPFWTVAATVWFFAILCALVLSAASLKDDKSGKCGPDGCRGRDGTSSRVAGPKGARGDPGALVTIQEKIATAGARFNYAHWKLGRELESHADPAVKGTAAPLRKVAACLGAAVSPESGETLPPIPPQTGACDGPRTVRPYLNVSDCFNNVVKKLPLLSVLKRNELATFWVREDWKVEKLCWRAQFPHFRHALVRIAEVFDRRGPSPYAKLACGDPCFSVQGLHPAECEKARSRYASCTWWEVPATGSNTADPPRVLQAGKCYAFVVENLSLFDTTSNACECADFTDQQTYPHPGEFECELLGTVVHRTRIG